MYIDSLSQFIENKTAEPQCRIFLFFFRAKCFDICTTTVLQTLNGTIDSSTPRSVPMWPIFHILRSGPDNE